MKSEITLISKHKKPVLTLDTGKVLDNEEREGTKEKSLALTNWQFPQCKNRNELR